MAEFTDKLLDGTYEHSPWIAEQAWRSGPSRATLAA
jgi:2-oxo-4-hydroxy-4-carboxy--5-ureidoimidazoline (OHCU) decarboxylase